MGDFLHFHGDIMKTADPALSWWAVLNDHVT